MDAVGREQRAAVAFAQPGCGEKGASGRDALEQFAARHRYPAPEPHLLDHQAPRRAAEAFKHILQKIHSEFPPIFISRPLPVSGCRITPPVASKPDSAAEDNPPSSLCRSGWEIRDIVRARRAPGKRPCAPSV